MNLEIQTIWSPDLDPPSGGLPKDTFDFDVFVQVSIGEAGKAGGELFNCRICSASALVNAEPGRFISHTLVLDKFDWSAIRKRMDKLLLHASSCKDWDSVITQLYPCLQHADRW